MDVSLSGSSYQVAFVDIISAALYVVDNVTQAAGCDFKENLNSPTGFIKRILRSGLQTSSL
jgi:hypothetical protein